MSAPAPLIVLMPGASLMHFEPHETGGLRVACPGCGASQVFAAEPGARTIATFAHEDGCPVHARIEAAVAEYERAVVRRG